MYDVVVIGSGPGGYVAALRAAQLGLKTACIEKRAELGGTCLNVGCIPSKALLHSTEVYARLKKEGNALGIAYDSLRADFPQMMARKNQIVASFNQGIAALFKRGKITQYTGVAQLKSPTQIAVGEETIETRHILLATGSEPIPLPFLPFDEKRILSSTGALALKEIPKRLLVIGAGVIGVELGSVYARLGCSVTFIEFLDRICPTLDIALSKELQQLLTAQGMTFHLSSKVTSAQMTDREITLSVGETQFSADAVLIAVGRRPYTQGLGLESAGIALTPKGFVEIDGQFRTNIPNIFAIGDLVDGPMLAHKASEEGIAVAEILAGHHPKIEYAAIPNVVYTHPEVGAVGLTEAEAKAAGFGVKVGTFPFKANSRARCVGEELGFVKIVAEEKRGTVLGIHILGGHASELIAEGALALQKRATLADIANTPHAHPTLSEAVKEAALAAEGRAIHK
ncbi:MAG: dihydrolipoyl dehydrogenase [Verrucomicrobia bacterium]|nr:dihydrolipoyl dehydrogenase [Verrucomicrobiota bacterium]